MKDEDDFKSVRCKACDKLFATQWYEDIKQWEDMCWDCIHASRVYPDQSREDELATLIDSYYEYMQSRGDYEE